MRTTGGARLVVIVLLERQGSATLVWRVCTQVATVLALAFSTEKNVLEHPIHQVMPEIYDILRHCEESHLTADEKSLLATQLAPHWTNSEEARRALETAVVYTEAEEEAEFWQGLQVTLR